MTSSVAITPEVVAAADRPFVLIAGPCVIESAGEALRSAEALDGIARRLGIPLVYKSSYDKANRSSVTSFRGVGIEEGLRILEQVRASTGLPVLSDVHSPAEAMEAGKVLDVLQIPAFLCRQTDLLTAAGNTGKVVNVKKGQFMAPWDMGNALQKVRETGNDRVMLTERGSSFGYNNLVVDMAGMREMAALGAPVIFDAGHSVQRPGGLGHATGGKREMIPVLARAAVAAGVAGVFLECHFDPDHAPCDGPNMWPIGQLEPLLATLKQVDEIVKAG